MRALILNEKYADGFVCPHCAKPFAIGSLRQTSGAQWFELSCCFCHKVAMKFDIDIPEDGDGSGDW